MTSVETRDSAPPALFDHCMRAYAAMLAEATELQTEDEATSIIVWEGSSTKLISNLNLSVPYYTYVFKALKNMGCVRQLRRGGGSALSQWELIYEPTIEAFERQAPSKIPKQDRYAMLEAQVKELRGMVTELQKFKRSTEELLVKLLGTEKKDAS